MISRRLIAYFDLLGFSSFVHAEGTRVVEAMFRKVICACIYRSAHQDVAIPPDVTLAAVRADAGVGVMWMSDSVLFYSICLLYTSDAADE